MSTATVDDVEAVAWPQPETVTELVTAEPASGMLTSVPLVALQPVGGGGVVPPEPVNSSLFGEPVPGLVTTPEVALATRALDTVAGVAVGLAARYSAAAPATCGVAIDVPLIVFVAVVLEYQSEVMLTPGAKMSTQVP